MIAQIVRRLILNLLVLPHDLYELVRDYVERARNPNPGTIREQDGALAKQQSWPRAAIVGIYPNPHSLPFLCNLLDGLAANGFFALAITEDELPPALREPILARCHHLIERHPCGRDFGSYKVGWEWVRQCADLKNIEALAFVNDSMYYPRTIGDTIRDLLAQKGDWLCLFENFQTLYHAQSFFQIFRGPVFRSGTFIKFWQNYIPTSVRLRVITKGEVGLTRALRDAGFEPNAYYNSTRLRADVLKALGNGALAASLQDALNLTFGFESRKFTGRPPVKKEDFLALLPADVAHKVSVLAEKYNPTHAVGLLCNYLYQAPVKRDICYRDVLTMSDLVALAQGFSEEERERMFLDLRRKGVPADFAGLRKIPRLILWRAGRI